MVITYLLMTDFGLALRSIGQNKKLAQNKGVNVPFITIVGLAMSNALIALGGALFSQYHRFTDIGSGVGILIIGLASIMIGERVLPYKSITIKIIGCLLGSIAYRLFVGFALHIAVIIGFTTRDLNLITGIMIIPIMYLSKRPYAKS
ncbi:MAG: hypothetical protein LN590_07510 [Rickettsia endosymbiont of Glossina mortisans submortisans]|nr:hypothetical protein [Rickettsia endosymbiont of Glossina mortisans submortisans]